MSKSMPVDVLLVDDEKHIQAALTRVMRGAGISTAAVSTGEEALDWLSKNGAVIILSDYKMPGMSGTELLAKVEARWPDTIRIILSGHSDFDTVLKAVHTGVVHKFLAKPWANQELIEHIKTSLASQQNQQNKASTECAGVVSGALPTEVDPNKIQLQVVLDTVVDGIVTINQKGTVLSSNSAIERIFGYAPSDLIGDNISVLMPEPYRSQHDHYLNQYQRPGLKGILGNQRRLVGLRKNGEVFPIELSVSSMHIDGETQFLGMIRDISRRVSAERQNQLLLDALEIAQDGVALFGAGDRLVHCNQQFRELYQSAGVELKEGLTYIEFFEQCVQQGLFVAAQEKPHQWLKQQLGVHSQLPVTQEYELRPGQWIEIHETQAENGSVIVSHLDISKQKQTQISLQRAVAEAEHANSARGRFLAMMSHEIRTPLNGVLGLLQLLQDTQLTPEQCRYVDHALSSGRGLLTVISDILDFSKIEADKLDLVPAPCQLRGMIEELEQLFQLRVEEKSIQLKTMVSDLVPDWVDLDGQRLRQILLNLLGNAIKFTDYGQVGLELTVDGQLLKCRVKDTGIGIPQDQQKKIFTEFSTISNASENRLYEGTGLGLSISHRLVGLMGGSIDFTSEQGVGSEFWFEIPFELTYPGDQKTAPETIRLKGNLLVVDDSPTNRLVAQTMLEQFGLTVSCAASGVEAIERYKTDSFDLILLDISMPGIDGLETFKELQNLSDWNNTPVLAFSAYALDEDRQRFRSAGMQGYLEKPLEKTVLLQTIAPYLSPEQDKSARVELLPLKGGSMPVGNQSAEALLDKDKLDQLAKDTSEEVLPELVSVFVDDAKLRLLKLADNDTALAETERHLHTLGSSALLYGLEQLSDHARSLETECRNGQPIGHQLESFIQLARLSLNMLQKHILQRLD